MSRLTSILLGSTSKAKSQVWKTFFPWKILKGSTRKAVAKLLQCADRSISLAERMDAMAGIPGEEGGWLCALCYLYL